MRCGFVTCVRLGEACIEEILDFGGHLDLLVTLRDDLGVNKSGRVYLDEIAQQHGIPLLKVANINEAGLIEVLRDADLDWLFIIGWSQIARAEVLHVPRRGVLGMHPTLLPEGRGRASIPWAILKRLDRTGVTLFRLDEGVDTGPILAQHVLPLSPAETATTLYERVVGAHRSLLRNTWPALLSGEVEERAQDETLATEWPGRGPQDGEIYPAEMRVADVECLVRALTHPYPGAFVARDDGRILRIWSGEPVTGSVPPGALVLTLSDGEYAVRSYDIEP
ncbi:MAG TPA: formyltransferase family protein [Mycobacteriales bacterium]|nr:formyltransferase family protein [Mycobacteriales bacterium]